MQYTILIAPKQNWPPGRDRNMRVAYKKYRKANKYYK